MKNLVKIFLICTVGFLAACSNKNTTLPRLSETELDQKSYAIAYSVTGQTYKDRVTKDYDIAQFTQGVMNWYYNRVPMPIEQIQALTINRLVDHKEYAYNSGVIFADAFQQKIEDANRNSGGLNPQEAQKTAIDEVNSTIKEVAKAKGYTLILQPQIALYAEDESKDITEAVLDAIKAKHPEIKLPEQKADAPKADAAKTEQAKPEEAKK